MDDYAGSRIGQQLGNYRLLRLLGQGGFADVYLGEHLYLKTYAALKLLRVQLTDDALQDFLNEARTVANLEHPHIVRVLEFGVEQNTPFLVMNYAPNGTLRQKHPRGTRLPLDVAVSYIQQIASALDYAHRLSLIHRDIKPENMLLGRSDEILLSDFGLALIAQSSASQSMKDMAGTIPYTAPEQLQGKPCPASDQYSLGIVVYEWLAGGCPFQGGFTEIISQHLTATPPPLYGRIPGISATIESIVFKALVKDPKERFASVTEFANALAQAMPTVQRPLFKNPLTPPPPDIVLQPTSERDASISPPAPLSSTSAHVPMNGSSQPASTLTPFGTQQPPMEAVSFWTQSSQPMAPISLPSQPTLNIPTNTTSQSTRILTPSDQSPMQSGTPLTSNPSAIASHSFKPGQFSPMPLSPEFSPEKKPRRRGFISKKALVVIALVLVVILGSVAFLYHAATVSKLPGPGAGITQTVGQTATTGLNPSATPINQSPTASHPTSTPGATTSTPSSVCVNSPSLQRDWQGWNEIPPPGNTTINSLSAASYNTKLYLFGKGTQDNSIYYTTSCGNSTSWSRWSQVPGGTNVIGLSAVNYNNKLYLFRTDTNNSISYTTYNGTWSSWTQIQGMLTPKAPTSVVYSYNNNKTLYLFSIDSSFYIHYITFNGNSLTRWSVIPLVAPNGHACSWPPGSQNAASDSPVAATSYQNELFVFPTRCATSC